MSLKGKRILVTAGPTWVKIDCVRVISNTASSKTGVILATNLVKLGAKVTLLLGPSEIYFKNSQVRVLRFRFFDELEKTIKTELSKSRYDLVIHSAAVSDYRVRNQKEGKIRSGLKNLTLKLIPTLKIIRRIKAIDPGLFLVGFKFEPSSSKEGLIRAANLQIKYFKSNIVVANTTKNGNYLAYLVSKEGVLATSRSRLQTVRALIGILNAKTL